MLKKFAAVAVLAAVPALAATKTTKTTKKATTTTTTTNTNAPTESQSQAEVETSSGRSDVNLFLAGAPGIIAGGGTAAPGVNLQLSATFLRDIPLALTFDTGPFFSGGTVLVPVLAGAEYRFTIPGMNNLHPFGGVSLGATISSNTVFTVLFRPGLDIDIARNLAITIEPRFGLMSSSFVFVGQAGLRLAL